MAVGVILVWGITGPLFHFSDTWQLVINMGTTVVTFLMVFLIQRSQNKDAIAIQVKLDELLAAMEGASNRIVSAEDLSKEKLRSPEAERVLRRPVLRRARDARRRERRRRRGFRRGIGRPEASEEADEPTREALRSQAKCLLMNARPDPDFG